MLLATGVGGSAAAPALTESGDDPVAAPPVEQVRSAVPLSEPLVTLVQRVERRVVLKPLRGGQLDAKGNDLYEISALGSFDVPEAALRAYKAAAATKAQETPSCQLPWTLLAGIGRVESDHGRYGGSVLGSDGLPRPAIRGVALNGIGPVAAIPDSDNGRFDGDKVWDRAVGPMQFIPTTWAYSGRDGDGDGERNPNDIDDAALAAADYLCPSSGSVLGTEAMKAAIFSYNHSDYYVELVMAFEAGYRTGTFSIPSPPPPPGADDETPEEKPERGDQRTKDRPGKGERPQGDAGSTPGGSSGPAKDKGGKPGGPGGSGDKQPEGDKPKGEGKPGGGSGGGTPSPSPTPTPSAPPAPTYVEKSGTLSACSGGWCLAGQPLDLGSSAVLAKKAVADHDGDGTVEANRDEFTGLEGKNVHVEVKSGTNPLFVTAFQGRPYTR